MHIWTVTSSEGHAAGEADTRALAWHAAHAVAADIVAGGTLARLVLEVDGDHSTITPAESGDAAADITAALTVIEAGRIDLVATHVGAEAAS